jgi:hypothetical protein
VLVHGCDLVFSFFLMFLFVFFFYPCYKVLVQFFFAASSAASFSGIPTWLGTYSNVIGGCLIDQFSDQLSFWVLGSFSVRDCYYCAEWNGDDYSFLIVIRSGVNSAQRFRSSFVRIVFFLLCFRLVLLRIRYFRLFSIRPCIFCCDVRTIRWEGKEFQLGICIEDYS